MSRPSWEAVSGTVAVLSLAGALAFNAVQVRQARQATQLQVLTEVNGTLDESVTRIERWDDQILAIRVDPHRNLSNAATRDVDEASAELEYLAWLFNHGFVGLPQAHALWGPTLVCEYEHVVVPVSKSNAAASRLYPNLARFAAASRPCGT